MEARYLQVEIREEALAVLLLQRRLVAEQLRGLTPRARQRLLLLLNSLLSEPRPGAQH